ncbi:MAG: carboxypeptidase-like regulatory domain-containing protein [Bacteroidia bacterium]|nr:carboxypeptidase-like regulatory domain-containing protein [Bacteroidia bacterium]
MKTLKLILILAIMPIAFASAQNAGSLKGRVIDGSTKEPLVGCNVYIDNDGSKIGTATDADGRFTIKPLPSGTYQVFYSFIGYNTQTLAASVYPGEPTFMKDVILSDVITIGGPDGVIIDGGAEKRVIDPGQIGKIPIKSAEIENIAGSNNPVMVIRAITSDAQISDDGKDIVFRGSRSGSSSFYIDGIKQNDMSSSIPGCAIGSIIVYSGGIPAQYGDVTGGIIVMETKSFFDVRAQHRIEESKKKDEQ